jgi:hypothetical protein
MISYLKSLPKKFDYLFFNKISSKAHIFNLKIDKNEIKYFLELKNIIDKKNFIWGGDWDKKKISISEYRKYSASYNSIHEIYKENKDYRECEEYKIKSKMILNGNKSGRGESLTELNDYFKSLDELKNSLNQFGYKSQLELNNNKKNDEIGIVIGSNSEIIKLEDKFGGTHRFALCKLLEIKQIIVSVKAIHKSLLEKSDIKKIIATNDNEYIISLLKNKIKNKI